MIDFGFLDPDEEIYPEYLGIGKNIEPDTYSFRVSFSFIDDETGKRRQSTYYIENVDTLGTKRDLLRTLTDALKDKMSERYEYTVIRGTVKIEAGYRS